jgi:hypothetical protein
MDLILGMDWMTRHGVTLDIPSRAVEINSPTQGASILYLPFRECTNTYAFIKIESKLEEILMVCEYADVFSDDLPRMPPDRDIEFIIELQPGTALSVTPDFKDKTECITICMPGSSSIHIVTSSVNNQQHYHKKRIRRL